MTNLERAAALAAVAASTARLSEDRPYKRFRVYVAQINAAVIEVEARDENEARAMGASKWRSDYAIPRVKDAEEICTRTREINMQRDRMWVEAGIDPA